MASTGSHLTSRRRQIIEQYYPEALIRTHTVPPVNFNKVPYKLDTVPGTSQMALRMEPYPQHPVQPPPPSSFPPASQRASCPPAPSPPQVMWPQVQQAQPKSVQDSDARDDSAQTRIIGNLESLGRERKEIMFILSQFKLEDYLDKSQSHSAFSQLPHPTQRRGEFDVLIIHRHYGILIGEVKSVGHNHSDLKLSEAQSDAAVVSRMKKSVKQLERLKKEMEHLVSDVTPPVTVRTTLFLPNVDKTQMKRVLDNNPQLEQDVCQALGTADGTSAVHECCCQDDLSARDTWWDVTPTVLTNLTEWWGYVMDVEDKAITDDVFLDVVSRFLGPASSVSVYTCTDVRVEVRTESEAIHELGRRLSTLVLTPAQFDLMRRQPSLVYLNGPPGTGKTLVMVLTGVRWVENQINTFVVSTHPTCLAISTLIASQISRTATSQITRVQLCDYDFSYNAEFHRAVSQLTTAAQAGAGFIVDEVSFNTSDDLGQHTYNFIQHLVNCTPGLHLWCAGVFHIHPPPTGLQVEKLTTPLRNAPAVLREVRPALSSLTGGVHDYVSGVPAPGDGQSTQHLLHAGVAHTGRWPVDCLQCGKDVATYLRRLRVGVTGSGIKYQDVFLLTRSTDLQEQIQNDAGEVTSQACGFVRGVREEGMPVCVLGLEEEDRDRVSVRRKLEDTATAATDCITAAYLRYVLGLERKVVVWLHGRTQGVDEQNSDEDIDVNDRFHLVTRCTTQLVVVDVPPTAAPPPDNHHHADDETAATTPTTSTPPTTATTPTTSATPPAPAAATPSTPPTTSAAPTTATTPTTPATPPAPAAATPSTPPTTSAAPTTAATSTTTTASTTTAARQQHR